MSLSRNAPSNEKFNCVFALARSQEAKGMACRTYSTDHVDATMMSDDLNLEIGDAGGVAMELVALFDSSDTGWRA